MHKATKRFIEILTIDVKKWEKAAKYAEAVAQHVPEPDRGDWKETAKSYRENAEEYKSIIKQCLEDNEENTFRCTLSGRFRAIATQTEKVVGHQRCPQCNGKGIKQPSGQTCEACRGAGELPIYARANRSQNQNSKTQGR